MVRQPGVATKVLVSAYVSADITGPSRERLWETRKPYLPPSFLDDHTLERGLHRNNKYRCGPASAKLQANKNPRRVPTRFSASILQLFSRQETVATARG